MFSTGLFYGWIYISYLYIYYTFYSSYVLKDPTFRVKTSKQPQNISVQLV